MKNLNELNLEIEMIKKDIQIIKNNHLTHIEADMRDVKIEVFRFKYVVYGAIIVFALLSDKADKLFNLLQEIDMPSGKGTYGKTKGRPPKFKKMKNKKEKKKGKC